MPRKRGPKNAEDSHALKTAIGRDYFGAGLSLRQIAKKYGYSDLTGPYRLLHRMGVKLREKCQPNPATTADIIEARRSGHSWDRIAKDYGFANASCPRDRVLRSVSPEEFERLRRIVR